MSHKDPSDPGEGLSAGAEASYLQPITMTRFKRDRLLPGAPAAP